MVKVTTARDKALFEELNKIRTRSHRLTRVLALRTLEETIKFVEDRKVAISLGHDAVASLPAAIAGHPIRGSWMADPAVEKIYKILEGLHENRVTHVRLLGGKRTVLCHQLSPAFVRIVSDDVRRDRHVKLLPAIARQLFEEVVKASHLATDELPWDTGDVRKARALLEARLLVASETVHTPSGRHVAYLQSWQSTSLVRKFHRQAMRLTYAEAVDHLLEACLASAVIAEERVAKQWFDEAGQHLSAMIHTGRVCRLPMARPAVYLTDYARAL